MIKEKSFTLIELLIVIAILGLLASIVFVSLRGSKESATIASGLAFGAQTHHALAVNAVGIWNFNEGTGATIAIDMSGNNNNGVIHGTSYECLIHDTPNNEGCSLDFDGGSDYVDCGSKASLNNISGEITIQAWVYPRNTSANEYIVSNTGNTASENGYGLKIDSNNKAMFTVWNTSSHIVTGTTDVVLDKWHHIVTTFNGKELKIYLDGKEDATSSWTGSIGVPASYKLAIGGMGSNPSTVNINALIADICIYKQTLTSSQIQKLYAQGIEKYNLLTNN